MSGFVVSIAPHLHTQERARSFQTLLKSTATYKQLELPSETLSGQRYHAAKLDSVSSLHKGIAEDKKTGSWLLAAGTVVDTRERCSSSDLYNLLQDYLQNGQGALQHYDGQFALVVYDGRDNSLYVISDPLGYFSIFYGSQGKQTFISTSALAVAKQIHAKLDVLAAECFLRAGQVYGTTTLWRDVKRVLPATILKIEEGRVSETEYWAPVVDETVAKLSFEAALDYATETLSRTVEAALCREGKIWMDLTGGCDTRLVTTMAAKANIPFITNCLGPTGHPDVTISSEISRKMGWEYRQITMPDNWVEEQRAWLVTALGKGDAHLDVLYLASILWGHQNKLDTGTVCVQGIGGELWRGAYWRHELLNIGKPQVNYDRFINFKLFLTPVATSAMYTDRTAEVRHQLKQRFARVLSKYEELPNTTKLDRLLIFKGTAHGGAYLSAAAGLMRCLMPLYFKSPTTVAFSLDNRWKHPVNQRFFRTLLEKENPRLANMMTTSGGPAVPLRLTNAHKFWPFWTSIIRKVTNKFAPKIFRETTRKAAAQPKYPLPAWKQGWWDFATEKKLFQPSEMHSAGLYDAKGLQALVTQAQSETTHDKFLSKIITLEMAMRAVGTSLDSMH